MLYTCCDFICAPLSQPPPLSFNDPAGKVAIRVRMLAPRDNQAPLLPLAPADDIEMSNLYVVLVHLYLCICNCVFVFVYMCISIVYLYLYLYLCICASASLQVKLTKVGLVVQVAGPLLSLIHTIVLCQAMLGHKCFAKQTNICLPPSCTPLQEETTIFIFKNSNFSDHLV